MFEVPHWTLLSGTAAFTVHVYIMCSWLQYITSLFRYGDIASIRMLPNRHCAFVNYTRPECAAQALKGLQVIRVKFMHQMTGTSMGLILGIFLETKFSQFCPKSGFCEVKFPWHTYQWVCHSPSLQCWKSTEKWPIHSVRIPYISN